MPIHKFVIFADIEKYNNEDIDKTRDKAVEIFKTNKVTVQWHGAIPSIEEHPFIKKAREEEIKE